MPEMLETGERNSEMITTNIITAKIEPAIFARIMAGEKRIEVRTDTFHGARIIRYVDASNPSNTLGYATVSSPEVEMRTESLNPFPDVLSDVACVDRKTGNRLFEGLNHVYLVGLGEVSNDLESLLKTVTKEKSE